MWATQEWMRYASAQPMCWDAERRKFLDDWGRLKPTLVDVGECARDHLGAPMSGERREAVRPKVVAALAQGEPRFLA